MRPLIVLAHGAGAASSSDWMRGWAERLAQIGRVHAFDYPYMREGRRRPDRHATLVAAHLEAIRAARRKRRGPLVLAGKSMGGRIGCHVAVESDAPVKALICFGYPLVALGSGKLRDEVLLALRVPVLFVQGTRDPLCPLDLLEKTRKKLRAPHRLHVVEDGDHSLLVAKRTLKERGETQADVDRRIAHAIADFLREALKRA